jgi:hypothetical protein
MQPDDEMAERIESDDLREQQPEHVHPLDATNETLAELIESDAIDEPARAAVRPATGRHVQTAVAAEETLAERMESDEIDE